ncbi:hypothetical protein [Alicyclobacillus sp. SO9]|uniref:hypothetical protein n=1 Tax=Alicyclobacillus sp. SO9 TaxID=2665646 RepID=UPI0018E84740|nr:hypothetical protein [Alicyclobacillus sp. SO9]QQE78644.1 hypothetical protein GI364_22760 [Alicyclobacillus sp. SO9]
MEYRVYVRFEDSPAIARKNSEQQPDSEYGPLTLEAVSGAHPGEETPMLHEALEIARENGRFIALYRGEHAGYNRRGAELFTPLGLAWCKDSYELAQMLGVETSATEVGIEPEHMASGPAYMQNEPNELYERNPRNTRSPRNTHNPRNESARTIPQEHTRPSQRVSPPKRPAAAPASDAASRGWLFWTGMIVGSFILSFVVVYGLAKLFG